MSKIYLSGFFFEKNGWRKNGLVWTKNLDTVTYDGTNWMICMFPNDFEVVENEGIKITWRRIEFVEDITLAERKILPPIEKKTKKSIETPMVKSTYIEPK